MSELQSDLLRQVLYEALRSVARQEVVGAAKKLQPEERKPSAVTIAPQAGPQTMFAMTPADIAIYGGAAGSGKSYSLLLEPLRHYHNSRFGGVVFRRNTTQVRNEGGLWDESMSIYPLFKGDPVESRLSWRFPSGCRMKFAHLEFDKTVLDYQGAQIPFMGFDELTHFSEYQFFYMLSRNRSTSGVRAYIRATTNPDPDSWVRRFIDWWIGKDGYPIRERSGKIRWFIRRNDEIVWADSEEEIYEKFGRGSDVKPKSVTFISAKLEDNPIFRELDPEYEANLLAMDRVSRMRLRDGNWNVRAAAGTMFRREWFRVVDAIPAGWIKCIRFWDRAATRPSETNKDPDWTRGIKLYKYADGRFLVADLKSKQDTPGQVETLIKTTASHDTAATAIRAHQDPGSAGVKEAENFIAMLAGYDVDAYPISSDKVVRAKPVSAQAEHGNVWVLRAPWNEAFFTELENFPDGAHDDIVDALSGAFNDMHGGLSIADVV
jgi:predicted phage terminase large subunit-like protein